MADKNEKLYPGCVVEFDFAALDGANILFDVAKKYLADINATLDVKSEALHLVGGNYQGGLRELFDAQKNKHDPAKAAKGIAEAFAKALKAKFDETGFTPDFKAFVAALTAKGVHVVLASRIDAEALRAKVEELGDPLVSAHLETAVTYGNCKWDAWNRALAGAGLHDVLTVAVTGSGAGVKSALVAGMSALGVVTPHVEWQDFGGADALVDRLDRAAGLEVLKMLKLA